jgi:probable rRNA maturation factor
VLTFDYEHEPVVVADLVLCAPVVAREAAEQGIACGHYAHLLVHGTLHAQGHDHEGPEARKPAAMEALESRILLGLGLADPYYLVPNSRSPASPRPGTM